MNLEIEPKIIESNNLDKFCYSRQT